MLPRCLWRAIFRVAAGLPVAAAVFCPGVAQAADSVFDLLPSARYYIGAFGTGSLRSAHATQSAGSGFYPSVNRTVPSTAFEGTNDTFSPGVGIVLGLERPINETYFWGVEGDFTWDVRGVKVGDDYYNLTHWGTIRLRGGMHVTPWLSTFASVGLAIADFNSKEAFAPVDTTLPTIVTRGSDHVLGVAASAGADIAILKSLRLRVEYLYVDFPGAGFTENQTHKVDFDAHIGRLGTIIELN